MSTMATQKPALHPKYGALVAVGVREIAERAKRAEAERLDAALRCEGVRRAARQVIDGVLFKHVTVPDPRGAETVAVRVEVEGVDGAPVGSILVRFVASGLTDWQLDAGSRYGPFGVVSRGAATVREFDWFPTLASALADLDARVAKHAECLGRMLAVDLEGQDEAV